MSDKIVLSSLPKTWLLDLDGTIVKHNGYLIDGKDSLLPGAKKFIDGLSSEDVIIFLTSRKKKYKLLTEEFLSVNGIRYNKIIYEMPYGERILINDCKPSGLKTALSINVKRDAFDIPKVVIDDSL